jgi:tetratricopeptide (TPR) repeat protein
MRLRVAKRKVGWLSLVALLVAAGEPAKGGRYTNFSQEEFRRLPRLCLAQRFINDELETPAVPEAERKQLALTLGHSFLHYHHYCWALLFMWRGARPGGEKFDYRQAIDNLNYVILHADPDFRYLHKVYFKKASVLERLGDRRGAVTEYRKALRAKPDYTPAAAALVQAYLELEDLEAARAALAEGLKHDPRSNLLAAKKVELENK